MAQTIALAGYANPLCSNGSTYLDLPFSHFLKSYKTDDPSPKTKLALPIWDIQCVTELYHSKNTLVASAVADLITIAFFLSFFLENTPWPCHAQKPAHYSSGNSMYVSSKWHFSVPHDSSGGAPRSRWCTPISRQPE